MTGANAFTSLEALLLFQSLAIYGVETAAFVTISELLKGYPYIRDAVTFDSQRLSPDSLKDLYLRLLKEESKIELDALSPKLSTYDPQENAIAAGSRKRKAPTPALASVQEASRHSHLLPQLITRLYARYREQVTQAIENDEPKYKALKHEVEAIERGEWEDMPKPQIDINGALPLVAAGYVGAPSPDVVRRRSGSRAPSLPDRNGRLEQPYSQAPTPASEFSIRDDQSRADIHNRHVNGVASGAQDSAAEFDTAPSRPRAQGNSVSAELEPLSSIISSKLALPTVLDSTFSNPNKSHYTVSTTPITTGLDAGQNDKTPPRLETGPSSSIIRTQGSPLSLSPPLRSPHIDFANSSSTQTQISLPKSTTTADSTANPTANVAIVTTKNVIGSPPSSRQNDPQPLDPCEPAMIPTHHVPPPHDNTTVQLFEGNQPAASNMATTLASPISTTLEVQDVGVNPESKTSGSPEEQPVRQIERNQRSADIKDTLSQGSMMDNPPLQNVSTTRPNSPSNLQGPSLTRWKTVVPSSPSSSRSLPRPESVSPISDGASSVSGDGTEAKHDRMPNTGRKRTGEGSMKLLAEGIGVYRTSSGIGRVHDDSIGRKKSGLREGHTSGQEDIYPITSRVKGEDYSSPTLLHETPSITQTGEQSVEYYSDAESATSEQRLSKRLKKDVSGSSHTLEATRKRKRDQESPVIGDLAELKSPFGGHRPSTADDSFASALVDPAVPRRPSSATKTYIWASRSFPRTAAHLMNDFTSHKHASLFSAPVKVKDAEGYRQIIRRPQDLKSIRAAISAGSKAVAAAAAAAATSNPVIPSTPSTIDEDSLRGAAGAATTYSTMSGSGTVLILPTSPSLMPPRAIVNSSQLERELMRMFANAVMFNPGDDGVARDTREMFESVSAAVATWRNADRTAETRAASGPRLTEEQTASPATAGTAARTASVVNEDRQDTLAAGRGASTPPTGINARAGRGKRKRG